MKKNLLASAAFLSMLGAIVSVGFALLQMVIAFQVETTGLFHGEEYSIRTAIYLGVGAILAGVLAYKASLKLATVATRYENRDQHPKSTIRPKP